MLDKCEAWLVEAASRNKEIIDALITRLGHRAVDPAAASHEAGSAAIPASSSAAAPSASHPEWVTTLWFGPKYCKAANVTKTEDLKCYMEECLTDNFDWVYVKPSFLPGGRADWPTYGFVNFVKSRTRDEWAATFSMSEVEPRAPIDVAKKLQGVEKNFLAWEKRRRRKKGGSNPSMQPIIACAAAYQIFKERISSQKNLSVDGKQKLIKDYKANMETHPSGFVCAVSLYDVLPALSAFRDATPNAPKA